MLVWLAFCLVGGDLLAAEHGTVALPGYRPAPAEGGLDTAFVANVQASSITVYPTVFRSNLFSSGDDKESQSGFARFFQDIGFKRVESATDSIDLAGSEAASPGQKGVFDASLSRFSKHLETRRADTDYVCVVEYLHTATRSGGQAIGGIQCYILNAKGQNVFSFLLNSHHSLFQNAVLRSRSADEEARKAVVKRADSTTMLALVQQMKSVSPDTDDSK